MDGDNSNGGSIILQAGDGQGRGKIRFATYSGDISFHCGPETTFKMNEGLVTIPQSLQVDGKVGIGTNSPNNKLHIEDGNLSIGNQSEDNWMHILQSNNDGYGYDFQHNNASVIVNEQGSTNQAIVLGDVDGNNNNVLFGVSHKSGSSSWTPKMTLTGNGFLGLGILNPQEMLSVNGTILAKEVRVSTDASDWPDFVFEDSYQLKDLSEVENFIKTNKHLPDIPSAAQMEEQGVNLAEMNKLLLQKVEELTLYAIELAKKEKEKEKEKELQNLKLEIETQSSTLKGQDKKLKELDALKAEMMEIKALLLSKVSK